MSGMIEDKDDLRLMLNDAKEAEDKIISIITELENGEFACKGYLLEKIDSLKGCISYLEGKCSE